MRRRLFLTLCLGLCVAGCTKFSDRPSANGANEYVFLTRYDVKTLDPAAVQDWTTGTVLSYLYPSIGKLCEIKTDDSKNFKLKLNKSTFTNGDMVTADDIRFTLERCLCSETLSTVGNQFSSQIRGSKDFVNGTSKSVEGIEIKTDGTIEIHLDSPDHAFAEKLKNNAFGVVNHKFVEMRKPLDKYTVGNGAGTWTLDKASPGAEWTLKHKITGELLKFRFSGDSANRRSLFDAGNADYAMFAAHEIGVVKGHKSLTKGGPTTLVYLQSNPKTKPGLTQALRLQLSAMVHTDVNFTMLLGDHVKPATTFLELSGLEPLQGPWVVTSAKVDSKEHFEITFAEIGMQNPSVEGIVTVLRKAGMDIQGRAMPSGAMLEMNAKGEVPILFTGWQPDFEGPLNTIPMLFHSKSSENHSGFNDPEVDKLIEAAQRGEDTAKNIQAAEKIISSKMPGIPLYVQRDLVLMRHEPPKP